MSSGNIPEGYTLHLPDKPCNTCILYGSHCLDSTTQVCRAPFPVVWDGYAMQCAYPEPYPTCKYHITIDEVKMLKENV